jgi:hypothetical protein
MSVTLEREERRRKESKKKGEGKKLRRKRKRDCPVLHMSHADQYGATNA